MAEDSRWTDRKVVMTALHDALSWNEGLLDALGPNDEHSAYVRELIARLKAVREKYYGKRPDPFKNAVAMSLYDIRKGEPTHTTD
jgi:hypothetical protein